MVHLTGIWKSMDLDHLPQKLTSKLCCALFYIVIHVYDLAQNIAFDYTPFTANFTRIAQVVF